jgi:hypothetical protein
VAASAPRVLFTAVAFVAVQTGSCVVLPGRGHAVAVAYLPATQCGMKHFSDDQQVNIQTSQSYRQLKAFFFRGIEFKFFADFMRRVSLLGNTAVQRHKPFLRWAFAITGVSFSEPFCVLAGGQWCTDHDSYHIPKLHMQYCRVEPCGKANGGPFGSPVLSAAICVLDRRFKFCAGKKKSAWQV